MPLISVDVSAAEAAVYINIVAPSPSVVVDGIFDDAVVDGASDKAVVDLGLDEDIVDAALDEGEFEDDVLDVAVAGIFVEDEGAAMDEVAGTRASSLPTWASV